jgi:hypothetical protein
MHSRCTRAALCKTQPSGRFPLLLYFTQDYPVCHIKAVQSQTLFQESGGCVDDHLGNMIVPRRFQSILSAFQIKK